jgi:hypothetical protein
MNTQNILKYFGSKLDIKLDHSEFYDYELGKVDVDYNTDVLDLDTPITYDTLKINGSLSNHQCSRNTIKLIEIDNSDNDDDYVYSGLTLCVDYSDFVDHIGTYFQYTILNNNVFRYTGFTNEYHLFTISQFNVSQFLSGFTSLTESQVITGFTYDVECTTKLESENCCSIPSTLNNKPWAFKFNQSGGGTDNCNPYLKRRTEKGWTLDFIFNRDSLPWTSGGVFYYYGVRGSNEQSDYADNNLSFQFTSDRRIKWVAHHYSGYCSNTSGYIETYYTSTGQTPQLCTTGTTKDFNVTIVFDRYNRYTDCNLENDGGWNDLLGWQVNEYSDTEVTAVTSTQLSTYESTSEFLNKKWADERQRRLGTLKIYLNGRPIYKLENWEEIVPSNRGTQPFIQSWGGGTGLMNNIHNGVCCFNIKSIKYYEEPLDFVHVRHNFLTRLNNYDFFICGEDCEDDIFEMDDGHIIDDEGGILLGDDDSHLIYNG